MRARRTTKTWFNDDGGLTHLLIHGTDDCYASIKIVSIPDRKHLDVQVQQVVNDEVIPLEEQDIIDILYETRSNGRERAHRIWSFLNEAYKSARDNG